ncbi:prolipoprotein diacylglyceryl transferase [Candidatus Woesearchaeota archaeon]|nr:MAG: prolipoprotein diacylglyceryl transferase [Candidatus Woesearchaeota archaeon]
MIWLPPTIFSIGPVTIRLYGLVYALSFLAGYVYLKSAAKRGTIPGLREEQVETLLLWLITAMIIGSRTVFFGIYRPDLITADPLRFPLTFLALWEGGMSFHGALAGMIIAALIFCKKHHVSFLSLADAAALPAALALFFGRIANFANGELVGTLTSVPWCIDWSTNPYLTNPPGGCRHPSQLYEAGKNLLIFGILAFLSRRQARSAQPRRSRKTSHKASYTAPSKLRVNTSYVKTSYKEGFIFWNFILLYGLLRFLVNFFRDDPRWLGISTGQALSLLMVLIAAVALIRGKPWKTPAIPKKSRKTEQKPSP